MIKAVAISFVLCMAFLLAWIWRPRATLKPAVWMLLIAYGVLGGWALWFGLFAPPDQEPAAFQYWKPTILYWSLSSILIAAPLLGFGEPVKIILGTYFAFSTKEWRLLNRVFAGLFAALGSINLLVAFTSTEGYWTGFKYSCSVLILFIILFRLSFVWIETMGRMAAYLYGRLKAYFS